MDYILSIIRDKARREKNVKALETLLWMEHRICEILQENIYICWSIEDIKSVDSSLTDEQCKEILDNCYFGHDATIGINWDVIEHYVNDYKEEKGLLNDV